MRGFLGLCAALLSLSPGAALSAGLSADLLFQVHGIWSVAVSPDGKWIIAHAIQGATHGLLVQKVGSGEVTPVLVTREALTDVEWVGDDSLVILAPGIVLAGWVRETDEGVLLDWKRIPARGWYVDAVPKLDGEVIWEFEYRDHSSLHRVSLRELLRYADEDRTVLSRIEIGATLARVRGSARRWVVDREGVPRAYMTRKEGKHSLFVRSASSDDFVEAYQYEEADEAAELLPLALSRDGSHLIVRAYHGSDTRGLYAFDLKTHQVGRKIYDRSDVDIRWGLSDPIHGGLIAATYEQGGERRFHYLDTDIGEQLRRIRSDFPSDELAIVSSSADRQVHVVFVSSDTNPGTYFFRTEARGDLVEVARVATRFEPADLSEVETLSVVSADGTPIEAFLTLPRRLAGQPAPLVVNPHGGPIGVRDSKTYNAFIQYLASWGFATLQVNYRGSSGYGRRFEEAGKRQWARGIEDDIDAAVDAVVGRTGVDGDRVCIVGGSYGGFSALASIIRHPARYRCAATINGVTDIPLSFETSDFSDHERILALFAENVGDIEQERDELMDISPVYHVAAMETPVFVLYGTDDRRVDPEHSHRLWLMLETLGKDHQVLELEGAAHGLSTREWIIVARAIRRFLSRHLEAGVAFEEDPFVAPTGYFDLPTVDR